MIAFLVAVFIVTMVARVMYEKWRDKRWAEYTSIK